MTYIIEQTIQETKIVVRRQFQECLPEGPFQKGPIKKIPRHLIARGRVLVNAKDHREFGTSLILISGKASVYDNRVKFRT